MGGAYSRPFYYLKRMVASIISNLFSDSGNISMMRVMSIISLCMGCLLAFMNKDATVIGIFVGAAFTGKAVQTIVAK